MTKSPKNGEPGWFYRRIFVYTLTGFSCWQLNGLLTATSSALTEALVYGWFGILATLVITYTGFATVQDLLAIWATKSGTPYRKDPE